MDAKDHAKFAGQLYLGPKVFSYNHYIPWMIMVLPIDISPKNNLTFYIIKHFIHKQVCMNIFVSIHFHEA